MLMTPVDYYFSDLSTGTEKDEPEMGAVLVVTDGGSRAVCPSMVPARGLDGFGVRVGCRSLDKLGCQAVTLQTDGEMPITAWAKAVRREWCQAASTTEQIEVEKQMPIRTTLKEDRADNGRTACEEARAVKYSSPILELFERSSLVTPSDGQHPMKEQRTVPCECPFAIRRGGRPCHVLVPWEDGPPWRRVCVTCWRERDRCRCGCPSCSGERDENLVEKATGLLGRRTIRQRPGRLQAGLPRSAVKLARRSSAQSVAEATRRGTQRPSDNDWQTRRRQQLRRQPSCSRQDQRRVHLGCA